MPSLVQSPLLQLSHLHRGCWVLQSDGVQGMGVTLTWTWATQTQTTACRVPLVQQTVPTNLLQAVPLFISLKPTLDIQAR